MQRETKQECAACLYFISQLLSSELHKLRKTKAFEELVCFGQWHTLESAAGGGQHRRTAARSNFLVLWPALQASGALSLAVMCGWHNRPWKRQCVQESAVPTCMRMSNARRAENKPGIPFRAAAYRGDYLTTSDLLNSP